MDDIFETGHCWNSIGVWGDGKSRCEKLKDVAHCRNCEIYTRAGRQIFEREITRNYLEYWTSFYTTDHRGESESTQSVIIFRLDKSWFALPTSVFSEVSRYSGLHHIPHHKNDVILGLVNVRGHISLCFCLTKLLSMNVPGGNESIKPNIRQPKRQMVLAINDEQYVFHVDEVGGVNRYTQSEFTTLTEGVDDLNTNIATGFVNFSGKQVFLLDPEALYHSIKEKMGE